MRKLTNLVLATLLTAFASIQAAPQQGSTRLPFENDQLRAVEYVIRAGEKLSLESRAPYLFFCVTSVVATLTFRNGQRLRASFKVDDVRWYESPLVEVANTGKGEAKFLIFELKKPAATGTGDVPADDGTKVAPDVYKLIFENERVRVIRVGVKPGGKTPMHSHPGSAFRYSMTDTKARLTMPDGTTREVENKAGFARWTELATRHAHESMSTIPGRTVLIEIK